MIDADAAVHDETAPVRLERRPVEFRTVAEVNAQGETRQRNWGIAVEAPVEIALNGEPWTVMLATPTHLDDLAIGIALTERVLTSVRGVRGVSASEFLQDISVNVQADDAAIDRGAQRARSLVSSTACGLCGIESLTALQQRHAARRQAVKHVADAAIFTAFEHLPEHQPVNRVTRSAHAAAWCTMDGDIVLAREDVGRHNALDKLVGAMAHGGMLHDEGFIVMSSRCSYELVYKAIVPRSQLLATISAPTSMALTWATALGLPLACRGSDQRIVRFPETSPNAA